MAISLFFGRDMASFSRHDRISLSIVMSDKSEIKKKVKRKYSFDSGAELNLPPLIGGQSLRRIKASKVIL